MKTRISKDKVDRLVKKYSEYNDKCLMYSRGNNISQARLYEDKMKTIRMTLSLLEIHIEGINKIKFVNGSEIDLIESDDVVRGKFHH